MITFRYHVVSIVAVLLALATGIVLGAGPLQRDDTAGTTVSGGSGAALTQARDRLALAEQEASFDDAFAQATAPAVVSRKLQGRAVTLVMLPGSDEDVATGLTSAVAAAGGAVTAQVQVDAKLLDVANRQLVGELATQVQASAKDAVQIPAGASGYERMGRLLGYAVGTTAKGGDQVDDTGDSILAALSTAELVTTRGNISRRGSLVVVVPGPPSGTADQREGAGAILATLADALDGSTDGLVVAGPLAAAAPDGLVTAVRSDPTAATRVSTVDVADRSAGAVVAVLALTQEATGTSGHYGADGADGAMPAAAAAAGGE